jgi:dephospho-CoA kinase
MKVSYIWITGTSAAGKTFVISELEKHIPNNDLYSDAKEILYLNELDRKHGHHIHPDNGEGFLLIDSTHFDKAVKNICKKLIKGRSKKLAFIELARGIGDNKKIDVSYIKLIDLIPRKVLEESCFIYIKSNWKQRLSRNLNRNKSNYLANRSFYVPDTAMKAFFRTDDFPKLQKLLPCPVFVLENNNVSANGFAKKVSKLFKVIENEYLL